MLKTVAQFGAAILIEPAFNPMLNMKVRGRTKTFHLLIDEAIQSFRHLVEESNAIGKRDGEQEHEAYRRYMVARHDAALNILESIFSKFVPPGITLWMLDFISENPPDFNGPRTKVSNM